MLSRFREIQLNKWVQLHSLRTFLKVAKLNTTCTLLEVDRREDCAFHKYDMLHISVLGGDDGCLVHLSVDVGFGLGELRSHIPYVFDLADNLLGVRPGFATEDAGGFSSEVPFNQTAEGVLSGFSLDPWLAIHRTWSVWSELLTVARNPKP